jgi:hypothetical protein
MQGVQEMWSSSFRQSALNSTTHLQIRFVISNALSLCSALAERQLMLGSTPAYARQWTFSPMLLDPEDYPQKQQIDKSTGPTSYNVIDKSNLTDFFCSQIPVSKDTLLRPHYTSYVP